VTRATSFFASVNLLNASRSRASSGVGGSCPMPWERSKSSTRPRTTAVIGRLPRSIASRVGMEMPAASAKSDWRILSFFRASYTYVFVSVGVLILIIYYILQKKAIVFLYYFLFMPHGDADLGHGRLPALSLYSKNRVIRALGAVFGGILRIYPLHLREGGCLRGFGGAFFAPKPCFLAFFRVFYIKIQNNTKNICFLFCIMLYLIIEGRG